MTTATSLCADSLAPDQQPDISDSLDRAARAAGAIEDPDDRSYVCTYEQLSYVCANLGCIAPDTLGDRQYKLRRGSAGSIRLSVQASEGEQQPAGWLHKKKEFVTSLDVKLSVSDDLLPLLDQHVRITSLNGKREGWYTRANVGWCKAKHMREAENRLAEILKKNDVRAEMSFLARHAWKLVNVPFKPEELDGRCWNRHAAQLAHEPSPSDLQHPHPHWDRMLSHTFADLDSVCVSDEWCQQHGIQSGRDWAMLWIAWILKHPFQPLPYLFFWGGEDCGKSILYEALSLLLTKGVVSADRALTNSNDFNGELHEAIICYTEEKNISRPGVRERIKNWVTGLTLSIRKMHTESFQIPNKTHWIQCANDQSFCPVFPGDSRIVVCKVEALTETIPKSLFLELLTEEAPAFLHSLLSIDLPEPVGRLALPVLTTESKQQAQRHSCPVAEFVNECCTLHRDAKISKPSLYDAFQSWCTSNRIPTPGIIQFGRELSSHFDIDKSLKIGNGKGRENAYGGIKLLNADEGNE